MRTIEGRNKLSSTWKHLESLRVSYNKPYMLGSNHGKKLLKDVNSISG